MPQLSEVHDYWLDFYVIFTYREEYHEHFTLFLSWLVLAETKSIFTFILININSMISRMGGFLLQFFVEFWEDTTWSFFEASYKKPQS